MRTFHDYLKRQLAENMKRRVLVWYDPRREFQPFVAELLGRDLSQLQPGELTSFALDGSSINFISYAGSSFEIRFAVEHLVNGNQPEMLLIYMSGEAREKTLSVLMELETGGAAYEPTLKRQARNALKELGFDDGHIDELLRPDNITYETVVRFIDQAGPITVQPSMLPVIFGVNQNDKIVAAWLATPGKDGDISEKCATLGLYKLIEARMGVLLDTQSLEEARRKVSRSLLVGEFKADLSCDPLPSLAMIETPQESDKVTFMRMVIQCLRKSYPAEYVTLADTVQAELSLDTAGIPAGCLGSIDTFRFEEQALLCHCDELITQGKYAEALAVEMERGNSFWVDRQVNRKAQWRVCRIMVELGEKIRSVTLELNGMDTRPEKWIEAYSAEGGWFQVDQLHRHLETLISTLDEELVLHQALTVIVQAYDALSQALAAGFCRALKTAQWQAAGVFRQTEIYEKVVARLSGPVAYFLVDSLRFEMGVELARQLDGAGEIILRPALAALPTITKIGMAALLPEASASFDVVTERDKLAARVAGVPLVDLSARRRFLKARQPQVVDLELGELLQMNGRKLGGKVTGSPLIVVRSQEIDSFGEGTSDYLARQVMDTVIGNVARAVRKLAACGIEHIVIAADHGHIFSREKGDDMKTDSPGGLTVELHRRCWIGQGGSVPTGAVKVSGNELGYDSPLDFIFPSGNGVFKAGGSLSYHHGGVSLQEVVIPLLTIRTPQVQAPQTARKNIIVSGFPEVLATRTMGITIEIETGNLLDVLDAGPMIVRPLLVCGGKQVGRAGMAVNGEFDATTGCVTIKPNEKVLVGMLLNEETATVQVVVLDPQTDAVLGQSNEIEVRLGM